MTQKNLLTLPEVHQPPQGFRYGIDSFLLARFARFQPTDTVCDLGTGVGILGLLALTRGGALQVRAVEVQEEMARSARKNIEALNLQDRMEVILENWKQAPEIFGKKSFDVVISNPPYRKIQTGKIPPNRVKAVAKHEVLGNLKSLVETAKVLLKNSGRFYVIYPPLRLEELILELHRVKMKIQRMAFVHPYADRSAKHFMVEAVLSTPREIHVEAPVIVYQDEEHYRPEIEAWVGKKQKIVGAITRIAPPTIIFP